LGIELKAGKLARQMNEAR